MLNNIPIRWISNLQKTVELSTYGSELVASTIATKFIPEIRYMLRSLGLALNGTALMLGYSMSVVLNTTFLSCVLKKKYDAITHEDISARIIRFSFMRSE
jgi:hypothetical protein